MVDWHERGDSVSINAGKLGLVYGVAGRRAEALEELRVLEEIAKERYIPPTAFALVHAGLDDMDEAFGWMDRAVQGARLLHRPAALFADLRRTAARPALRRSAPAHRIEAVTGSHDHPR